VKNFSILEPQPGPHPEGMDGEWTENYFPLGSRSLPKHGSLRSVSVFPMWCGSVLVGYWFFSKILLGITQVININNKKAWVSSRLSNNWIITTG